MAATRRPEGRPLMRQTWSELLFLHWRVGIEEARRLLPEGLDLDTHDGEAWVGLVPFRVSGMRAPFLPPFPGLSRFDEVNVRTYVHRAGRDPGVWFFSLDASSRLAVAGGRALYHLGYRFARMEVRRTPEGLAFASHRIRPGPLPASCAVRYAAEGPVTPAVPGTLEHFLLERYMLYAAGRRRLYRARVFHDRYPAQGARLGSLEEDLVAAAGFRRPEATPLAHYASAVEVEIFPPRALG